MRLGDGSEGSVNIARWATDKARAVSPFEMDHLQVRKIHVGIAHLS